jgi:hypothetical protein
MAIEVAMSHFIGAWCGAPYSMATSLANNTSVTKRCPSGHDSYGRTKDDDIRNLKAEVAELRIRNSRDSKYTSQLKGQITKLKKRLEAAAKEKA